MFSPDCYCNKTALSAVKDMNNNVFRNLLRQMPSLQSSGVIQTNKENKETISISINTIGLKLMFEVVSIKYFIVSRLWTIQLNTCKMFWKISHHFLLAFLYVYCVGTKALLLPPSKPHAYMCATVQYQVFIIKEGVLGFKKRFSGFSPSLEEQGMLLGMGKRARQPLEGNGGSISYYDKSDVSNNNTVGWTFHFSIPFTTTRCWCSTKQALHLLHALPWGPRSVWNHLGLG